VPPGAVNANEPAGYQLPISGRSGPVNTAAEGIGFTLMKTSSQQRSGQTFDVVN
jgi:hypothetical protein